MRAPLGTMPASSELQLSDEDLAKMAEYIVSLAPPTRHVEPTELADPVVSHHWMTISAIKTGNGRDALHHVRHIIELVRGQHLRAMREAERLLRAGNLHEAEHIVERMLAGRAKPDLTPEQLHLQLALNALQIDDAGDAEHHMRHFLETARGSEASEGRRILEALKAGDLHEAEDGIQMLLAPHEQ